jgi:N-acetylglucosaminyl-diphospho-decaprenol L-rhamnosyltransferase
MSGRRRVGVVIPSWNSVELLPRCLGSLRDQGVEVETIVVDNGSGDGSREYLEREAVPHLSLPRNVGFAAAVNLGVARISAPAVLVLNADTVLEPGAVRALIGALEADDSLAGVQPRILQLEEGRERDIATALLYSAGQGLSRDGRAFEDGAGEGQRRRTGGAKEIFGVCGAACLLRRELFEELGGYDERYFAFYEDVDLNVRARIAGWRFAYIPEAVVWHVGNASWMAEAPRPGAWNARLVARNRVATQIKFMPARALPLILAAEAGSLLRALARRRLGATLRGKLEGLRWLPALLRERRRLRQAGDLTAPREWLGRAPREIPGPPRLVVEES